MARTEREIAHDNIIKNFTEEAQKLCAQAIENVANSRQDASFSVSVRLEPSGEEGADVKATTKGRITLSTPQQTDHYSIDGQTRLED